MKADVEIAVELLYPLFRKIWKSEEIPPEWKDGNLIRLPKKGDLRFSCNYR
ncbi:hypothetical protein DPMN_063007 [Dreissena polymorpha]|uniref:Uncharacterized protein n=1 Tax=Dreissena polymorpha TaxID=45954 RepID=A0A9D4CAJ4_DREPO|nr:hypothetical protein DPMN_063007 [Dreissena polymorpha]